jgi:hypothetical protein
MYLRTALLSLSALAAAKEMPKDELRAAQLYDSGIRHENNVALKKVTNTLLSCEFTLNLNRSHGHVRKLQACTTLLSMLRSKTK